MIELTLYKDSHFYERGPSTYILNIEQVFLSILSIMNTLFFSICWQITFNPANDCEEGKNEFKQIE